MTRQPRHLLLATLALLTAASARLINLQTLPPGLARDEALNADIVSFIWQGQHALFFREGFGHEPLYHYFSAIFHPLIGDNFLSIRLPSVFLGLLLVALTYRWIKRDFGRAPAGITLLLLSISWWPIIFSRVGLRPISFPLLLVATAWFWPKRPWLAGLCLGLSIYTYTAARAIYLIPFLFLIYLLLNSKQIKKRPTLHTLRSTLYILITSLLIYLPLALTLRADPTLQERIGQLTYPIDSLREGNWQPVLEGLQNTLGVFTFNGDPLWSYTLPGLPLFDWVTGFFFYIGLGVALGRAIKQPKYALLLVWLAVTLLPSIVTSDSPSTIRLIGAMPVVYLVPALGLTWLTNYLRLPSSVPRQRILYGVAILITLISVGRTYQRGFVEWANAPDVRQKYQSVWLDMSNYWRENPAGNLIISDSWYEPIKSASLERDFGHELPDRWVQQGNALIYPAGTDTLFLIPEFAPPHPILNELAGLTNPVYRSEAFPSFAAYRLMEPPPGNFSTIHPFSPPNQSPALHLRGLDILNRNPLELITYWDVQASLPPDSAIFIHLLDDSGQPASQFDGFDAIPITLRPGDTIIHYHTLPIPDPNTPYTFHLGLYNRHTGQRWLHTVGASEASDSLILDPAFIANQP